MKEENYSDIQDIDSDFEEEDVAIDWAKYASALWKHKKKIVIVTVVFAILSIFVALSQEKLYRVSVTLAPEVQTSSRGGGLGNLANMFGVNLGNGSSTADAMNITIFPEIVRSTPFLTDLFEVELNYVPQLPDSKVEARKVLEGPLPTVKLYDHLSGRDKTPSIWSVFRESLFGPTEEDPDYLRVNPSVLTAEQAEVLNKMRRNISASVDKKTTMTTITVMMDKSLMCSQLADTVCRRLREYVFKYRTQKEQSNFDYYQSLCDSTYQTMVAAQAAYASSIDNDRSVVLQSVSVRRQRLEQEASIASQVYQQMVQQREMSRARLQEMKPVFAIVEPATKPFKPVNSRKKICVVITMLGFVLACGWYGFCKELLVEKLPRFQEKIKIS